MRGKRPFGWAPELEVRNIPAYAGKTHPRPCPKPQCPEHPRVCGENSLLCELSAGPAGTSPRMRGKLPGPREVWGVERNIPAYAGKTGVGFALNSGT